MEGIDLIAGQTMVREPIKQMTQGLGLTEGLTPTQSLDVAKNLTQKLPESEINRALGAGPDGKGGPDWSFAGENWSDTMASIPYIRWDSTSNKFVKERIPLMNELGGGDLIYEPFKFIGLPLWEFLLQERAELYNKLDISSGITNYIDYGKRMLTTSEDAIRVFLLMLGLKGLGEGLGGRPSGGLPQAYQQTASGGVPQAYQQTGTGEEQPERSTPQQYSSSEPVDTELSKLKKTVDSYLRYMDEQYASSRDNYERARTERQNYQNLGGAVLAGDLLRDVGVQPNLYTDLME